jgi:hypothetical protein
MGSRKFEIHLGHSLPSILWIKPFLPYLQTPLRDQTISSMLLEEGKDQLVSP